MFTSAICAKSAVLLVLILALSCLLRSGAAAAQDSSATTAFDMQVLLTDPAFTVVINATVLATLYTGTAGTNTSIYQATNITGVRTYTNVSTGVVTVSTITGLLAQESFNFNDNFLYPFNSIYLGFIDYAGIAFTVSPPAPLAGVAQPVSSISVAVAALLDEPTYAERYDLGTEQVAQQSLLTLTPGTPVVFPPPQTFDLYVLLSDPTFTVTINATVTGFLYSGTANTSGSAYQATSMTGVRVFNNGTGFPSNSVITGLLPEYAGEGGNLNLFYPFNSIIAGFLDYSGIAFTVSPPAILQGVADPQLLISLSLFETIDEPLYVEAAAAINVDETVAQSSLVTFTPGTPWLFPPPQTFHMQVLLLDPAFNVTIDATVEGFLYSGTANSSDSVYQATNITGVRVFNNGSLSTTSAITGLLPIVTLDNNDNLFYPFQSEFYGFINYAGIAFEISPPGALQGISQLASALGLALEDVADEPVYAEYTESVTEVQAQSSLLTFTPGTPTTLPPPQTFELHVVLSDPAYSVIINATVTAFLYGGMANSSDSVYQATNITGVRVYTNSSGASVTSAITGLQRVQTVDYDNDNLIYPFNTVLGGFLDAAGIAFAVSPAAPLQGVPDAVPAINLYLDYVADEPRYNENYDYELEVVALSSVVAFTPGTLPTALPPSQPFHMQVLLLDPEFSVGINATVMGFLLSGTANSSDSVYQATNMTGVRVFTNVSTGLSTVSAITGVLPVYSVDFNLNLFYPFISNMTGFLDASGLAFAVSPAAQLAGVAATVPGISLILIDAFDEPQYIEQYEANYEQTAQSTVVSFTPGTPPLAFPPPQSFHLQAVLEDTTWRVTIDATVEGFLYSGVANSSGSTYQATSMTGVRVYTNLSSGTSTSSVIVRLLPVLTFSLFGDNDNLFFPFQSSSVGTIDFNGISFSVSPDAVFSSGATSDVITLRSPFDELGSYTENYGTIPQNSSATFVLSADLIPSSSSSSSSSTGPASLSSSSSASLQSSSSSAVSPLSSAAGSASSSSSSSSGSLQPSSSSSSFRVGVIGDPQFVGLLGQSFQVHGVSGFVYSLIIDRGGVSVTGDSGSMSGDSTSADSGSADSTSADRDSTAADRAVLGPTLVNARFIFLSSGRCPPAAAAAAATTAGSNCWSHPGSYLGELGVVSPAGDRLHIVSGAWDVGFHTVTLNGATMDTHRAYNMSTGASAGMDIAVHSPYSVSVTVGAWQLTVDNSDRFVNLVQLRVRRSWAELSTVRPHGLLGQTWQLPTSRGKQQLQRYVQGAVDDYVEQNDDIMGHHFVYQGGDDTTAAAQDAQ